MQRLRAFLDRFLFEEYRMDAASLGLYRILFAAYMLVAQLPRGLWRLPAAAYAPPVSVAALLTQYPPHALMLAFNALALACACCLLLGLYAVPAALGLGITSIIVNSFSFADGKIDQGVLCFVALAMARSGWDQAFSLKPAPPNDEPRQPWLSALVVLLIGFALFTAGSAKLRGGWARLDTQGTRYHLFWDYYVFGRKTLLAGWAFQHLPAWAWKVGDLSTVMWETGFVLSVFRRSWCRTACAVGALFHLGVWLLFDIKIASNLIAYASLVSWSQLPLLRTLAARSEQPLRPLARSALTAAPFVFALGWLLWPDFWVQEFVVHLIAKLLLCLGAVSALVYLGSRVRRSKPALPHAST